MMNKKRSSQLQLGKYVFLLPVLIIAGITFTVNQAEAKIERVVVTLNETDLNQQIKKVMIQHPRKDTTDLDSIKNLNTRAFADYIQGKPRSGGTNNQGKSVNTIRFVDITPSKRPLVILDGEKLPINFKLDAINPKSIKSLRILKEAEAKSYGEEAKNGVIVIETKKEVDGQGAQGSKELRGEFIGMKANNNIDTASVPVKVITKVQLQEIPKDTKIIIDEKESDHEEYKKLNPNELENVHIIKDSNGGKPTIKFTTKEFARKNNLQSTTFSGKPVSEPRITVKGQPASGTGRIAVKGEPASEPARMTVKGEPDSEITQVIISNPGHTQNSKPGATMVRGTLSKDALKDKLVVIDGKIANKKAIDKLDNNQIEYLNQLDPQGGKALYGKKGEKGVLIIGTKSN